MRGGAIIVLSNPLYAKCSCLFADNVERLFVDTQPNEYGMPHLAITRPLGEFYLANELGNKPCGRVLVLHLVIERLLVGAQRLHGFIERFQRRLVEAGADTPRIDPPLLALSRTASAMEPKYLRDLRGSV
jgi:hypothetical protein